MSMLLSWDNFCVCSHGEKFTPQGRLTGVVQRVTHPLKLPQGNEKLMQTVVDVRLWTEVKLTEALTCPRFMSTGPLERNPQIRFLQTLNPEMWDEYPH